MAKKNAPNLGSDYLTLKHLIILEIIVGFIASFIATVFFYFITNIQFADLLVFLWSNLIYILVIAVIIFFVIRVYDRYKTKRRWEVRQQYRRALGTLSAKKYTTYPQLTMIGAALSGLRVDESIEKRHFGVLWKIIISNLVYGSDPDLSVEVPPLCPKCKAKIEEERSALRLIYVWRCQNCNFKKISLDSYNYLREQVLNMEEAVYLQALDENTHKLRRR